MPRLTLVAAGLVFGVWAPIIAAPANSCSCITNPTSCRSLVTADAVFEATVASLEWPPAGVTYGAGRMRRVTINDIKVIRGTAAASIVTPWDPASCGYDFKPGHRYLVVAHRGTDGRLAVYACGETRPIESAATQLEYLRTLNGPSTQTRAWGVVRRTTQLPWVQFSPTPVAGARVTLRGPVQASTTTDAEGRFTISGLPRGSYDVEAVMTAGGTSQLRSWPGHFDWKPADTFACAVVDLAIPTAGRISGTMMNDFGEPVHNATALLHAVDPTTKMPGALLSGINTDQQGRYAFSELPPGTYMTTVNWMTGPTFVAPHPVTIAKTSAGAEVIILGQDATQTLQPLRLERLAGLTIVGMVRDQSGLPVGGVTIGGAGIHHNGARFPIPRTAVSGVDGTFELLLWRGQRYAIHASLGGRRLGSTELVASTGPVTIIITR
jgi:hypothetical protein